MVSHRQQHGGIQPLLLLPVMLLVKVILIGSASSSGRTFGTSSSSRSVRSSMAFLPPLCAQRKRGLKEVIYVPTSPATTDSKATRWNHYGHGRCRISTASSTAVREGVGSQEEKVKIHTSDANRFMIASSSTTTVAVKVATIETDSESEDDQNTNTDGTFFVVLGLLWCIAAISAIDRVAMSVALVPMSVEFNFDDTTIGLISSLFSIGYGLAIVPAGLFVSFVSPKTLITFGISMWSIATMLTPISAQLFLPLATTMSLSLLPILIIRSIVGMGEAILIPTIHRLLSVWTTSEQKSSALAFIFSGFHAGTIGAYLFSPLIMDTGTVLVLGSSDDWSILFYVYGTFGILLLVPWLLLAKDEPITTPAAITTYENRSFTLDGNSSDGARLPVATKAASWDEALQSFRNAPWDDFIQSRGVWGMLLAHCAKNWGLYTSLSWTPTFYAEQYNIGVRDSAWLSVMPSIAGAFGAFIAGTLADQAIQNISTERIAGTTSATTQIRKQFQTIGLLGPALALAALAYHIPDNAWVAQIYLMVAVGLQSFNAGGFEAGTQDKAGPKWIGMLYSVTSLPSVMVGTFGVYATGFILDISHQDWSIVWYMNAVVNVLGAVAFITLYDSKREFE